jgi:hypothetical protein
MPGALNLRVLDPTNRSSQRSDNNRMTSMLNRTTITAVVALTVMLATAAAFAGIGGHSTIDGVRMPAPVNLHTIDPPKITVNPLFYLHKQTRIAISCAVNPHQFKCAKTPWNQ